MIGVGTFKTTPKTRQYVNDVLTSERLSYGPYTKRFEAQFAAAHGCRFAIMTNSGTSSLLIALAALKNKYGWADGDEVIVPAVTFVATSNIVIQLNMKPVLVDVDPVYYELNPDLIEAAITPRTRCIIPVHLFGLPCDMRPILRIAEKHGLRIIEDSCETMFSQLDGTSVGAFGDIGCFSTYIAHILTTGVGGVCTTNDPALAVALRSLMNHGRDSIYLNIDDDKNKSKEELQMIIQRRFSFVQMGYSFRVTEMEGALGLAQLEEHEQMMKQRRENGEFLIEALKPLSDHIQLPKIRPGANHAFMMFPIVLRKEKKTDLVNYLEAHGIETRDMLPLTNQPYYAKYLGIRESDFPVAQWINESGFYVASHQGLSDLEKRYMVSVLTGYFAKKRIQNEKTCMILMSKRINESSQLILESLGDLKFDEYILATPEKDARSVTFQNANGLKLVCEEGAGKGSLLKKAIQSTDADNIIVMGMDGCDDPKDANNIMIKLKQGADLVIASRFLPGGGRESERSLSYRSVGNRFFTFLISVIFDSNVSDSNNMFRGFKKSSLQRLSLNASGEDIMFEMTVKAVQNKLVLAECPTIERPGFHEPWKRNRVLSSLSFFGVLIGALLNPAKHGSANEPKR